MTMLTETDVQADLNAVNDQLTTLVEELNKMNAAREQLVTPVSYTHLTLPTSDLV